MCSENLIGLPCLATRGRKYDFVHPEPETISFYRRYSMYCNAGETYLYHATLFKREVVLNFFNDYSGL